MRATARCSSRSATVGIPNGRVPVLPWAFGYFNPPDRWCAIGAGSKLCANFFNPLLQLTLKLLGALPVDATGRAPVHHAPRFREKFRRQQVRQRGESHRAMQFGLLRYLTQLR